MMMKSSSPSYPEKDNETPHSITDELLKEADKAARRHVEPSEVKTISHGGLIYGYEENDDGNDILVGIYDRGSEGDLDIREEHGLRDLFYSELVENP